VVRDEKNQRNPSVEIGVGIDCPLGWGKFEYLSRCSWGISQEG
jgi:hypothetical protein